MKIATWNLARPRKGSEKINAINATLSELEADILVLTETIQSIDPGPLYRNFHTVKPLESYYRSDERRVSIYSKYDYYEEIATWRSDTSICVHLDTPLGSLAVYGAVVDTEENIPAGLSSDLEKQIQDFERIRKEHNLCICGDLYGSFSANAEFAEKRRKALTRTFAKNNLQNLSSGIPETSGQIILSRAVENNCKVRMEKWNVSKTMSDHLGVSVMLIPFEQE